MTQPCGDAFADVLRRFWSMTMVARPTNSEAQSETSLRRAAQGARHKARIGVVILIRPHVDERRTMGDADEAREFVGRD